jgi:hypothetical protein
MKEKKSGDKIEEGTLLLYGQKLDSSDILQYLPDIVKNKLSDEEKGYIEVAFYSTVKMYKIKSEQNYVDRIVT